MKRMWRGVLAAATVAMTGAGFVAVSATASEAEAGPKAKVGHEAPDFTVKDINGTSHTLSDYTKDGKIVVLEWFNPDCPFVVKHHKNNKTMAETYAAFQDKNVVWIAINSGKPGKQGTGLDKNKRMHTEYGMSYPVALDESGKIGRMYGAKTTPHMFVVDANGVLAYAGAIDDRKKPAGEVNYVKMAVESLLAGETISMAETKPYGCGVKY